MMIYVPYLMSETTLFGECIDGEFAQIGWGESLRGVIPGDENVEEKYM